jgi:DinB superfamily
METPQVAPSKMYVRMIVSAWETQNTRVDKMLSSLSDEQLSAETAPGRNTGVYLLGHLAAVNDNLFPLLGFGEKLYPELEKIFLSNPENAGLEKPSIASLREYWKTINNKLMGHIDKVTPEEWLTRHNSVSSEDFAKEPHRNKLNILINRANHQSYHLGQLAYLSKTKK